MSFLRKLDMFGAPLSLNLNQNEKYYRSRLGAISTLIVYSLILAYGITNIRIWANGDLLSTITTEKSILVDQYIAPLSHLNISLKLHSYNQSAIKQDLTHQYLMVYLDSNNNSIATMDDDGYYHITLDPNNFEVSFAKQVMWIGFENGQIHSSTVRLGATIFEMQQAAVIQTKEYYYGFTSSQQFVETVSEKYGIRQFFSKPRSHNLFGQVYVYQFFNLEYVCDLVRIQYPPIQIVIGNIGAIAGILLYIQYLIMFYNSKKAEELMVNFIIGKLFPWYQQIKIKKYLNRIQTVTYEDREIDKDKYIQFYRKMSNKIKCYQSFPHMILNQIEVQLFMKLCHPNYKHFAADIDELFETEGLLNYSSELQKIMPHLISDRSACQEPSCQGIR